MELGPPQKIRRRLKAVGQERRFWEPDRAHAKMTGRLMVGSRTEPRVVVETVPADGTDLSSTLIFPKRSHGAALNALLIDQNAEELAQDGISALNDLRTTSPDIGARESYAVRP